MKKNYNQKIIWLKRRFVAKQKRQYRNASALKVAKYKFSIKLHGLSGQLVKYHLERSKFRRSFFRNRKYKNPPITINIDGEFGLEETNNVDRFLDKASEIIDFDNTELKFNLKACERIWPSALTLLCSLKQWVELSTWNKKIQPRLASTNSNFHKVNSYLYHSGFNQYVGLNKQEEANYYKNDQIVKIRRETNPKNVEDREDEILEVLGKYTDYTRDQLRLFHAQILIEIFLNVTEHGVSGFDNGWWVLAQYHPKHKIISVNIADNGIGIKNSLLTGPQGEVIKNSFPPDVLNDGELIRYATWLQVSGALKASSKERASLLSRSKYPLGSKRGNGLDRIKSGCKELGIELTILSHHGCLGYDCYGNESCCITKSRRVFAGTLYHLNIPAKEVITQ